MGLKRDLTQKLKLLGEGDRGDDNLVDFIDTKVQLNLEIFKDEAYWE